jgi:hypothetical protein
MNASTKSMPIVVHCLGWVIPTLNTWIYFDLLASSSAIAQKIAYVAGKLSQVGIMLVDAAIFVIDYLLVFA